MDLRKLHNMAKRDFINSVTRDGYLILDAGCGCGGDMVKWGQHNVVVYACDPDTASIHEARRRAKNKSWHFFNGDISKTPVQPYDIICYNFSLQYIFESEATFTRTIKDIVKRSKVGTMLMGVVPDSDDMLTHDSFTDHLGNVFDKGELTGEFGDTVKFFVKGAPYYSKGPRPEPVCYKDILSTMLLRAGFERTSWEPLLPWPTGTISDMYARFIFTRIV